MGQTRERSWYTALRRISATCIPNELKVFILLPTSKEGSKTCKVTEVEAPFNIVGWRISNSPHPQIAKKHRITQKSSRLPIPAQEEKNVHQPPDALEHQCKNLSRASDTFEDHSETRSSYATEQKSLIECLEVYRVLSVLDRATCPSMAAFAVCASHFLGTRGLHKQSVLKFL